jgi:hypothetical protein
MLSPANWFSFLTTNEQAASHNQLRRSEYCLKNKCDEIYL